VFNFAGMKKIFLFLAIVSIPAISNAQFKWDFGGGIGVANYLGDIGGGESVRRDFVMDMKLQKTRWSVNGFARYKISPSLSVKGSLGQMRIEGDDALSANPARYNRNLSFRNDMWEMAFTGEYYFYKSSDISGRPGLRGSKKKKDFRSYVFGGVGLLYHNPKAELNGSWVALAPLQTEGVAYDKIIPVVPLGLGFSYTINRHHRIGFELGWRMVFSDYLDDVSSNYIDPKDMNETARALQNRNGELYDATGNYTGIYTQINSSNYGFSEDVNSNNRLNKRGDPSNNDNYLTAMVSYSYVMKGKNKFYKAKYKSLSQRRKVVKRKTRAKF
jgi:hypothetical protein